jgi:hypothetical protein
LSEYDDLLKEVKGKAAAFQSTAREYIPKMYQALRKENHEIPPTDARDRIEKDCAGIWSKRTLLDALPDEAKNPEKQKAARLGQTKRNSAAFSAAPEAKKKILIDTQGRPTTEVSPETSTVDDLVANSQQNRSEKQIESDSIKHSYSPEDTISNEDVPDILNLEFSLPYQVVQPYMAKEHQRGKNNVWFNVEINMKTNKVISAKVGRTTESNISN